MNDIEQKTFNTVAHISAGKALSKLIPTTATMGEIFSLMKDADSEEVRKALRSLTRSGRLTYGRTINDFYFKINTDGKE